MKLLKLVVAVLLLPFCSWSCSKPLSTPVSLSKTEKASTQTTKTTAVTATTKSAANTTTASHWEPDPIDPDKNGGPRKTLPAAAPAAAATTPHH